MSRTEMEILLHEAKTAIKCANVIFQEDGDHNRFTEYVWKAITKLTELHEEL